MSKNVFEDIGFSKSKAEILKQKLDILIWLSDNYGVVYEVDEVTLDYLLKQVVDRGYEVDIKITDPGEPTIF